MKKESYALVDCNSFYAACERVFRPDLLEKPIGILSNNDGCIVALSKELKSLKISRGTPFFKIKHLIDKHKVNIFSSNYALYGDLSDRVMTILNNYTPELEIYSIDEAFLNLSGMILKSPEKYGKSMRDEINKCLGIPVSVGIGPTKTLAKLANHIAKKYKTFDGVFNVTNHPNFKKVLESVAVGDVWGIGFQYEKMLKNKGIENAYQFSQQPDNWIKKNMSIIGLRTAKELRGISCIESALDIPPSKSILSSRSFSKGVLTLEDLEEATASYCTIAAKKLREQHLVAGAVMVFLQTNRFKEEPQYANYKTITLRIATAYTPTLIKAALDGLQQIFRDGYSYKKTGVMLSNLTNENNAPLDFFDSAYVDTSRKKLMDVIDKINIKMGINTVKSASCGIEQDWKMRREFLSPQYSTKWSELRKVK